MNFGILKSIGRFLSNFHPLAKLAVILLAVIAAIWKIVEGLIDKFQANTGSFDKIIKQATELRASPGGGDCDDLRRLHNNASQAVNNLQSAGNLQSNVLEQARQSLRDLKSYIDEHCQ